MTDAHVIVLVLTVVPILYFGYLYEFRQLRRILRNRSKGEQND